MVVQLHHSQYCDCYWSMGCLDVQYFWMALSVPALGHHLAFRAVTFRSDPHNSSLILDTKSRCNHLHSGLLRYHNSGNFHRCWRYSLLDQIRSLFVPSINRDVANRSSLCKLCHCKYPNELFNLAFGIWAILCVRRSLPDSYGWCPYDSSWFVPRKCFAQDLWRSQAPIVLSEVQVLQEKSKDFQQQTCPRQWHWIRNKVSEARVFRTSPTRNSVKRNVERNSKSCKLEETIWEWLQSCEWNEH